MFEIKKKKKSSEQNYPLDEIVHCNVFAPVQREVVVYLASKFTPHLETVALAENNRDFKYIPFLWHKSFGHQIGMYHAKRGKFITSQLFVRGFVN